MTISTLSRFAGGKILVLLVAFTTLLHSGITLASGQYCEGGGVTIERPDLSPQELSERCRDAAELFGDVPLVRGSRCTICAQSMVRVVSPTPPQPPAQSNTPPPVTSNTPPPPPVAFPPGTTVLQSKFASGNCAVHSYWYLIPSPAGSSNCPSPYINGGHPPKGTSTQRDTTRRWCGICPAGYKIDRFKRCCNP